MQIVLGLEEIDDPGHLAACQVAGRPGAHVQRQPGDPAPGVPAPEG